MKKPDLEKYAREMLAMKELPLAPVRLPPLAVFVIISHIQLAVRHPKMVGSLSAEMAIDVAKQLQELFDAHSETYKVLELGWDPEADIPMPHPDGQPLEEFCEEPCANFLQNLGCRCTEYKVAEVVDGDKEISSKTLAAGAAMMHQVQRAFYDEGFEIFDM
jgi:hypothetical protein